MQEYHAKRYSDPTERALIIERARLWYRNNKEKKSLYDKARRAKILDAARQYDKDRSALPHRLALKREWSRKRKMSVTQATPRWVSSNDKDIMRSMYKLAVIYTQHLVHGVHVDHIIPLHGEHVSGLHTPSNLQLMWAFENISKGNRQLEEGAQA